MAISADEIIDQCQQEGRRLELVITVLKLLGLKLDDELPEDIKKAIRDASLNQLQEIINQVFDIESEADIREILQL